MQQTVLILGASGRAGRNARQAFHNAGWNVRLYDRSTGNMAQAAMGADVIFNGLNPPNYHNWKVLIPQITTQVIAAAKASGATILMPGNVYVYGTQPGPWSADTRQAPCSRKGRIRVEMEQMLRAAAKDGVQTILLRAGDFIDPLGNDLTETVYFRNIRSGRIVTADDPAIQHAYAFMPDYARAFVMLAERRSQLAGYEDIPFEGHAFTMNELGETVTRLTGRGHVLRPFPWWLIRAASPFSELFREMLEMRYLWSHPHRLDGSRLRSILPDFVPTPMDAVVASVLRHAKVPLREQGQLAAA